MKLLCPFSGVHYEVPTFKLSNFKEHKVPHPFLSFSLNEVLGSCLPAFSKETIFGEDLHLFGTFLILQLPIETWGNPLLEKAPLDYWISFWLANIEKLASLAKRLDGKKPRNLPAFSMLGDEHAPLHNLGEWIRTAHACIDEHYASITPEAHKRNKEFRANLGEQEFSSESQCNAVIEKILRGSLSTPREKEKFPELISNWAAKVGDFPNSVFRKSNGDRTTLRNFWKQIIQDAFDLGGKGKGYSNILTSDVTVSDLDELIEHCQENIPCGTMHSRALYEELAKLKEVIQEFRPLANRDNLSMEILSSDDIHTILADVSHLPVVPVKVNDDPDMPRKEDYPTLSSFVKAKMAYKKNLGEN